MWEARSWDGIGVYHYEWSNGLSTALLTEVGPETGVEVYYNFAVTTDLQVIDPANE